MNIKQTNEELELLLKESYTYEEKLKALQTIDLNKCDLASIYDGTMMQWFNYSKVKDEDFVRKTIKQDWDIDVPVNKHIDVYNNPTDWQISSNGARLYVAEFPIDDNGYYVDFCIDYTYETDEEFDEFIKDHQ